MLDNLRVFVTAAEQRSLTRAAAQLAMTVATVSRRVSELEQQLQCELFHRSNKGLILTPAGQSYYDETADFIHELDLRLCNLDQSLNSLHGELRIMAPTNIGSGPLDRFWRSFAERYPQISLQVKLGDPDDDVMASQVDIAIRSGPQQNSSLIQRRLGTIEPVLVAGCELGYPIPRNLGELNQRPSVAVYMFSDWHLHNGQQQIRVNKKHNHLSNDMNFALNLVRAGAGIALLPRSMVQSALDSGELIQVLPEWKGTAREISLLWPQKRTLSVRARLFRDELMHFLQQQNWINMQKSPGEPSHSAAPLFTQKPE